MTDTDYIEVWLITDMLHRDPSNRALQQKARDLLGRLRRNGEIPVAGTEKQVSQGPDHGRSPMRRTS